MSIKDNSYRANWGFFSGDHGKNVQIVKHEHLCGIYKLVTAVIKNVQTSILGDLISLKFYDLGSRYSRLYNSLLHKHNIQNKN